MGSEVLREPRALAGLSRCLLAPAAWTANSPGSRWRAGCPSPSPAAGSPERRERPSSAPAVGSPPPAPCAPRVPARPAQGHRGVPRACAAGPALRRPRKVPPRLRAPGSAARQVPLSAHPGCPRPPRAQILSARPSPPRPPPPPTPGSAPLPHSPRTPQRQRRRRAEWALGLGPRRSRCDVSTEGPAPGRRGGPAPPRGPPPCHPLPQGHRRQQLQPMWLTRPDLY